MRTIIINKWCASVAAALFWTQANAAAHEYVVSIDAELAELRVMARFAAPPGRITARSRSAGRYLDDARDCESGDKIRRRGRQLVIDDDLRCLEYRVDLRGAARAERWNRALDPGNIVVSPARWLWRPPLASNDSINVTFNLPDGIQASVPWPVGDPAKPSFRLNTSPRSGSGVAVFGRFDTARVRVADVDLRVDLLRGRSSRFDAGFVDWVAATANNIALAYGRFPNPDARVVLYPVASRGDSPVRFGQVVRDGGETVELLVDPDGPRDELYRSWMATHEFAHLMVPHLERDRRWISEGFAQYYQNLLLARAGQYDEQYAWKQLLGGFERGRDSVPRLSPNAATETGARDSRMKIYWSGAALALLADVELRRRSNNRESLDTALGAFQQCCLPSSRTWSGLEFFTRLDEFVGEPLFVELYRRVGETAGFPDVDTALSQLGVYSDGDAIVFDDDAPLAEIRAALTVQRYTEKP